MASISLGHIHTIIIIMSEKSISIPLVDSLLLAFIPFPATIWSRATPFPLFFRYVLGYGFPFYLSTNCLTLSDLHGVGMLAFLTHPDLFQTTMSQVIFSIYLQYVLRLR